METGRTLTDGVVPDLDTEGVLVVVDAGLIVETLIAQLFGCSSGRCVDVSSLDSPEMVAVDATGDERCTEQKKGIELESAVKRKDDTQWQLAIAQKQAHTHTNSHALVTIGKDRFVLCYAYCAASGKSK